MPDRDPRRRVLARIESEPIPYGTWSALFDTIAEAAANDMGVMIGGHVIDCDDGWQPAEGAEPESWRPALPAVVDFATLPEAVKIRMRTRAEQIRLEYLAKGYREVETEHGVVMAPPDALKPGEEVPTIEIARRLLARESARANDLAEGVSRLTLELVEARTFIRSLLAEAFPRETGEFKATAEEVAAGVQEISALHMAIQEDAQRIEDLRDELTDAWHEGYRTGEPLRAVLGMTEAEYGVWATGVVPGGQ